MNPTLSQDVYLRTVERMGTLVNIQVVGHGANAEEVAKREAAVERAFDWFSRIETSCTRFDPASELARLSGRIGEPVPVSAILYEALQFALAVAEETGGAFDPTVGREMEERGFDRNYRSGRSVRTALASEGLTNDRPASYRDVRLDPAQRTVTLLRPLVLDLGAVAKGLAVDMAARELAPFRDFGIDAGGDLYLSGRNPEGAPWSVGIRHPRRDDALLDSIRVSDRAVCTSGDYERVISAKESAKEEELGHHILDPRSGQSAGAAASVTVVAPTAMLADALATAAFVLGPTEGIALLERLGVDGLIVTAALERHATRGLFGDPAQKDAR